MIKALSLGWGVQSWTLAAMSALGDIEKLTVAIHSDTQHERGRTYEFAQAWTPWLEERGVRVVTVVNEDREGTGVMMAQNRVQIPAFTIMEGKKGQIRRQCTQAWKIMPLRRWLQAHRERQPVELWLGISMDEWHRAKDSGVKYLTHRFPLIERKLTRQDCLDYLEAHGLPSPGKSSCVFCPYLNKASWQDIRLHHPEDWQEAVRVDNEIRDARLPGQLFVHGSRKPLEDAVKLPEDAVGADARFGPPVDMEDVGANWESLRKLGREPIELLASDDDDAECDSGHCFL